MSVLYHGGVPDLKPGDTIEPGHSRANHLRDAREMLEIARKAVSE